MDVNEHEKQSNRTLKLIKVMEQLVINEYGCKWILETIQHSA